jgi:hypothetical protein
VIRFLVYALLAFIAWKILRIVLASRRGTGGRPQEPPPDFPPDRSYKNIQDADFEDITRDPDKPS